MNVSSEHDEQVMVIQYCDLMAKRNPDYGLIFAIPNGGQRSVITAALLKAEGVKKGVPDLFLPVPKGIYCGLFLEMKRRKGGRVSKEQVGWLANLMSRGYKCVVARGFDEAREAIEIYMEGDQWSERDRAQEQPEQ